MSKRVRFNLTPEIHIMVAWNYAYHTARVSMWQNYAIDRYRFQNRIKSIEKVLEPILSESHRHCIWARRIASELVQ